LQVQDLGDPGDVDALGHKVTDPGQEIQIVCMGWFFLVAREGVGCGGLKGPVVRTAGQRGTDRRGTGSRSATRSPQARP
jgi:hypothetical protein